MKLVISAALLAFCLSAQAEMTGRVRDNFISSFSGSCFSSQRSAQANSGVPDKVLRDYCSCSSEFVARQLSNDEVARIEAGKQSPDRFTSAVSEGSRYCRGVASTK